MILALQGLSGLGYLLDSGTLQAIGNTITQIEGYYPGTPAYINNNPGNLIASSWTASQPGYLGAGVGGFGKFDNITNGTNAMYALIDYYAGQGYTIQQMINKWAPAGQGNNNPISYAASIGAALGVDPNTPLTAALAGSPGVDPSQLPASTPTDYTPYLWAGAAALTGLALLS